MRPGDTHTAADAAEIVHRVFNAMPQNRRAKRLRRLARADAGFSNISFFNACSAKDAGFVVRMHDNMLSPNVKNTRDWKRQNPQKESRIMFYDGRECEIGETFYRPENGAELLRIVILRAVKPESQGLLLRQEQDFDYFGFVTNIGAHEMSGEKIIRFYRQRGHAENFIKELKYGFDLKHYPCQKLLANKAYGLIDQ